VRIRSKTRQNFAVTFSVSRWSRSQKLPLEYYRQGTILVLDPDPEKKREFKSVKADGTRADAGITHEAALAFAQAAADDFGVGENKTVPFDAAKAKAELKGGDDKKAKKATKNKAAVTTSEGTAEASAGEPSQSTE